MKIGCAIEELHVTVPHVVQSLTSTQLSVACSTELQAMEKVQGLYKYSTILYAGPQVLNLSLPPSGGS